MPDFIGTLQRITLTASLWLIPGLPLAAALFHAYRALARRFARSDDTVDADRALVLRVAVVANALALLSTLVATNALRDRAPTDRYLLEHLWRLVRVGQLDANFDLAFDPLASVVCLVVTFVALIVVVFTASSNAADARARIARTNVITSALLFFVLADNFVSLSLAGGLLACSVWSRPVRVFVLHRFADASFVIAAGLIFWGFGGVWTGGDYTSDLEARFAAVDVRDVDEVPSREAAGDRPAVRVDKSGALTKDEDARRHLPSSAGKGLLTMTSYPGALVFLDESHTPLLDRDGAPLYAPFRRFAIPGGIHTLRIHPGMGLDDYIVSHISFGEDREVALADFGPTVTFRKLRDQLELRDANGDRTIRDRILARPGWRSIRLATLACFFLFVGIAARASSPVLAVTAVYALARLGFLFELAPAISTLFAIAGASIAAMAAIRAAFAYDLRRVISQLARAHVGVMIFAAGAGAFAASIFHFVTTAVTIACLGLGAYAVAERANTFDVRELGALRTRIPRTARAVLIATIALSSAPVPLLACFWSGSDVLFSAIAGENLGLLFALAGVVVIALAVASFAAWRSYFLVFEGPKEDLAKDAPRENAVRSRCLLILAATSASVGVVLGLSTRSFGGEGESILQTWIAHSIGVEPLASHSAAVSSIVAILLFAAGLLGWSRAKRRYEGRAIDWQEREKTLPLFALFREASTGSAASSSFATATAFVGEFDRRVVDGAVRGIGLLARVFAWINKAIDDALVDGAARLVARATHLFARRARASERRSAEAFVYTFFAAIVVLAVLQYFYARK